MEGVSIRVKLPSYGGYKPEELTNIVQGFALSLVKNHDVTAEPPCTCSEREIFEITKQRMRDLLNGSSKSYPNDVAKQRMEEFLANYGG